MESIMRTKKKPQRGRGCKVMWWGLKLPEIVKKDITRKKIGSMEGGM